MPLPVGPDRLLSKPWLASRLTSVKTKLEPGASLKLKVIVPGWPDLRLVGLLVIVRIGASVSMAMNGAAEALPLLPTASE